MSIIKAAIVPPFLYNREVVMIILFYTNYTQTNSLYKDITNEFSMNITFKDEFNILNDTLEIECDIENFIANYNYCYIPILHRYYFITDYNIITNSIVRITVKVDVLMTYNNIIQNGYTTQGCQNGDCIKFNDFKDYHVITNPKFNNLVCTNDEYNEIVSLLSNGVYFGDYTIDESVFMESLHTSISPKLF